MSIITKTRLAVTSTAKFIPQVHDGPLWDLMQGVFHVHAVCASTRLGLFEALQEKPLPFAELAQRTGCSVRGITLLVQFLASQGFVILHPSSVELSPLSRTFLLRGSPFSYAPLIERLSSLQPNADDFERAARSGQSAIYGQPDMWQTHQHSPAAAASFARGAHCRAHFTAARLAEANLLANVSSLLDVGGGLATYAVEFAKSHPSLQVTVLDIAPVVQLARVYVEAAGVAERVQVRESHIFVDAWPSAQDRLWLADILHDWDRERCVALARRAFEALRPGGKLLVCEVLLNEDGSGPQAAASLGLAMLYCTQGQQYRFSEVKEILESVGFASVHVAERCGVYSVVSGERPAITDKSAPAEPSKLLTAAPFDHHQPA